MIRTSYYFFVNPGRRKLLIVSLSLLLAPPIAWADSHALVFYPHLSTPAATPGGGDFVFEAFPGSNGLQQFFYNALDVGIGNYFEVGTAPFFYLIPVHRYNFNAKLNFLKLHSLQMAIGYSQFTFTTSAIASDGSSVATADYTLAYYFAAMDMFFSDRFAIGFHVAKPSLNSSSALVMSVFPKDQTVEWFVDFPVRFAQNWAFTPGFGVLRLDTLDPGSKVPFGFGGTITWIRGKAFLGDINVGLQYLPKLADTKFLFGFSL
jgi:hypothetical protein